MPYYFCARMSWGTLNIPLSYGLPIYQLNFGFPSLSVRSLFLFFNMHNLGRLKSINRECLYSVKSHSVLNLVAVWSRGGLSFVQLRALLIKVLTRGGSDTNGSSSKQVRALGTEGGGRIWKTKKEDPVVVVESSINTIPLRKSQIRRVHQNTERKDFPSWRQRLRMQRWRPPCRTTLHYLLITHLIHSGCMSWQNTWFMCWTRTATDYNMSWS